MSNTKECEATNDEESLWLSDCFADPFRHFGASSSSHSDFRHSSFFFLSRARQEFPSSDMIRILLSPPPPPPPPSTLTSVPAYGREGERDRLPSTWTPARPLPVSKSLAVAKCLIFGPCLGFSLGPNRAARMPPAGFGSSAFQTLPRPALSFDWPELSW